MKALITVTTFCLLAFLGFWIDSEIVKAIMSEVPKKSEWIGIIKIGVWIVILFFTTGLIFGLSALISSFIFIALADKK
jgi:uncharacterized protein involved in cysteine biosynthesis